MAFRFFLIVSFALTGNHVRAFLVFSPSWDSSHRSITRDALQHLQFTYQEKQVAIKIDDSALESLVWANVDVDLSDVISSWSFSSGPSTYEPRHHFDNESFYAAQGYIDALAEEAMRALKDNPPRPDVARLNLGKALHAVQDFYSHSNWIEMGNTAPHPYFGRFISDFQDWNLAMPCEPTFAFLGAFQKLTSGYYAIDGPSHDICDSDVKKDFHGGSFDLHFDSTDGINKDSSSAFFSPHGGLHSSAAKAATEASKRFLYDFMRGFGGTEYDLWRLEYLFQDRMPPPLPANSYVTLSSESGGTFLVYLSGDQGLGVIEGPMNIAPPNNPSGVLGRTISVAPNSSVLIPFPGWPAAQQWPTRQSYTLKIVLDITVTNHADYVFTAGPPTFYPSKHTNVLGTNFWQNFVADEMIYAVLPAVPAPAPPQTSPELELMVERGRPGHAGLVISGQNPLAGGSGSVLVPFNDHGNLQEASVVVVNASDNSTLSTARAFQGDDYKGYADIIIPPQPFRVLASFTDGPLTTQISDARIFTPKPFEILSPAPQTTPPGSLQGVIFYVHSGTGRELRFSAVANDSAYVMGCDPEVAQAEPGSLIPVLVYSRARRRTSSDYSFHLDFTVSDSQNPDLKNSAGYDGIIYGDVVSPRLSIFQNGEVVTIQYDGGALATASSLDGPWETVLDIYGAYSLASIETQRFFKVIP